tara:strand:+ start:108 stop:314 length:207 start_codon:yes stop_codon:yes gene_type:complete
MSNNQIKKRAAYLHNKKRNDDNIEHARLAQDKIDNPWKYAKSKAERIAERKALAFAAMASIPISNLIK